MGDGHAGVDFARLTLSEVSRQFGRRWALVRVSLTCDAGEILGLIGPNGAGKSTLLAIVATLLAPTSGEVRYGAHTAKQAGAALRARIGLLAHDLLLYPELTARENLEFFARLYRVPDPRRRAAEALDRAGLGDRSNEVISSFSRGMRQRLALERALLHSPRLVLLDEPFTGLDDEATSRLVDRLRELKRDGAIVVLATHDLETVQDALDRVAVLRDGRLVELGAPAGALRERYRLALRR